MKQPCSKRCRRFVELFLIAIISFYIIQTLFRTGQVDLVTPIHSDLYRYFLLSQNIWDISNWMAPRPLMLAYIKLGGIFRNPDVFFILLAIPAFVFVTALPFFLEQIFKKQISFVPILAFFVVVFGSPWFFPQFQYDYGGMMAGFFAVGAVYIAIMELYIQSDDKSGWWVWPTFLSWCSIEAKPTYAITLLSLSLLAMIFKRDLKSKLLLLLIVSVLAFVFTKDALLGSPFIQQGGSGDTYSIVIDPIENARLLLFYIKSAFTPALLVVFFVSSIVLIIYRERRLLLLFVLVAISASVPMALLINRYFEQYSWYTTVFIGLITMFATGRLLNVLAANQRLSHRIFTLVSLGIISIGLMIHMGLPTASSEWNVNNQVYNKNIIETLKLIKHDESGKILITNAQGPYHPLRNTEYIKNVFSNVREFDVLLRHSEYEWNEMSKKEQTNGIYLEQLNLLTYSEIFVLDNTGKLAKVYSSEDLLAKPLHIQHLMLISGDIGNISKNPDPIQIAKAVECLNNAGEFSSAVKLGIQFYELGYKQPWIFYHMAISHKNMGEINEAIDLLTKAVSMEKSNTVFASALQELNMKDAVKKKR